MHTLERVRPTAESGSRPGRRTGIIKAVIVQARRRQRRRRRVLISGAVIVLALGCAAGGLAATAGGRGAAVASSGGGFGPGPGPDSVNATVLMYPVHEPASAPQGTGLAAYVGDLSTGHLSQRLLPGIINCNCGPVEATGGWLVYGSYRDTTVAMAADFKGRPRTLGNTSQFAPAATPGRVWLIYQTLGTPVVRLVPVAGGPAGPPISLPLNMTLIEGTTAGLLLEPTSQASGLELWTPRRALVRLPASAGAQLLTSTPRVAVYGAGCRDVAPSSNVPADSIDACQRLLAYDSATGKLSSFAAPARTAGWFAGASGGTPVTVSPDGSMVAAMTLVSARGRAERLFVLPLSGAGQQPRAVPGASGSQLTWSADSRWLFYQGTGSHLWAYQPATSQTRHSTMPCCRYWAMTAIPGGQ